MRMWLGISHKGKLELFTDKGNEEPEMDHYELKNWDLFALDSYSEISEFRDIL